MLALRNNEEFTGNIGVWGIMQASNQADQKLDRCFSEWTAFNSNKKRIWCFWGYYYKWFLRNPRRQLNIVFQKARSLDKIHPCFSTEASSNATKTAFNRAVCITGSLVWFSQETMFARPSPSINPEWILEGFRTNNFCNVCIWPMLLVYHNDNNNNARNIRYCAWVFNPR